MSYTSKVTNTVTAGISTPLSATTEYMFLTAPRKDAAAAETGYDDLQDNVRRPLIGVRPKKDAYAVIEVTSAKGPTSTLKNSSAASDISYTSNLLITAITEQRTEKMQPVLTFGKEYLYFFGQQPREIQFSAILLNAANFRWEEEWWENYDSVLRATKLAARHEYIRLYMETVIYEGYMISCTTTKDANDPIATRLNFMLSVTNVINSDVSIGTQDSDLDYDPTTQEPISYIASTIGEGAQKVLAYNTQSLDTEDIGFLATVRRAVSSSSSAVSNLGGKLADYLYGSTIEIDPKTNLFGSPMFAANTKMYREQIEFPEPAQDSAKFVSPLEYPTKTNNSPSSAQRSLADVATSEKERQAKIWNAAELQIKDINRQAKERQALRIKKKARFAAFQITGGLSYNSVRRGIGILARETQDVIDTSNLF